MLWPYAGGWLRGQQSSVCRQTLPPLSLSFPFPSIALLCGATNLPLWEPSTALTTRVGLGCPPPPKHPHLHSRQRHPPFRSTSHCVFLCSHSTPRAVSFTVPLKFAELCSLTHVTLTSCTTAFNGAISCNYQIFLHLGDWNSIWLMSCVW